MYTLPRELVECQRLPACDATTFQSVLALLSLCLRVSCVGPCEAAQGSPGFSLSIVHRSSREGHLKMFIPSKSAKKVRISSIPITQNRARTMQKASLEWEFGWRSLDLLVVLEEMVQIQAAATPWWRAWATPATWVFRRRGRSSLTQQPFAGQGAQMLDGSGAHAVGDEGKEVWPIHKIATAVPMSGTFEGIAHAWTKRAKPQ